MKHVQDVVQHGAEGLKITTECSGAKKINADLSELHLVVSAGLITDAPLPNGNPWTLSGYMKEIGEVSIRGKKTLGFNIPLDVKEDIESVSLPEMIFVNLITLFLQEVKTGTKKREEESAETPNLRLQQ